MFCKKSCTYNLKYTIIILFQFMIFLTYYFLIKFHKYSRFYFHYLISLAAHSTVQVYFKNFSRRGRCAHVVAGGPQKIQ